MIIWIGAVLCLVGAIWIVVNAFRESILWGIGSLLITPVAWIFAIMHFDENKIPLLLYVIGVILAIAGAMTSQPVSLPTP